MVLLTVAGFAAPSASHATVTTPSTAVAQAPTVTVEAAPRVLDFDDLARVAGQVPFQVRSKAARSQGVTVSVVWTTKAQTLDQSIQHLVPAGPQKAKVPAGQSVRTTVAFDTADRPKAGVYDGAFLAAGPNGVPDVSKFTLAVARKPTTNPAAGTTKPARLTPPTIKDFSVQGTNFVPSIFSPLPAFVLGAGVFLLALMVPFTALGPFPNNRHSSLARFLVVVALAVMVGGGILSDRDDGFWEGKSPHIVRVNSPSVGAEASSGPVGSLVSKDGTPAMAVVHDENGSTGRQLVVQDAEKAGVYVGGIDLIRGVDGGEASMTANINDYWLWALLVIALGVGLGWRVSSYFTRERPRARQQLRAQGLLEALRDDERALKDRSPSVYDTYSVKAWYGARVQVAKGLLDSGEPEDLTKATSIVDGLQTYGDGVRDLWRQVEELAGLAQQVQEAITALDLQLPAADAPSVMAARNLVAADFDADVSEQKSTYLDARVAEVIAARGVLVRLRRTLPSVAEMVAYAHHVQCEDLDPAHKQEFIAGRDSLYAAAKKLALSATWETASAALLEAATAYAGVLIAAPPSAPAEAPAPVLEAVVMTVGEQGFDGVTVGLPPTPVDILTADASTAGPPVSAAELRAGFVLRDRDMTIVSGLIAVFSGLVALYSVTPSWGTPSDYLKALLWGGGVSEGIKVVTGLVAKSGPAA